MRLNQALLAINSSVLSGQQVRQRGEILLDIDSTDDPTHGQQQLSFFNGAYDQHSITPCSSSSVTPEVYSQRACDRVMLPVMPVSCPCC